MKRKNYITNISKRAAGLIVPCLLLLPSCSQEEAYPRAAESTEIKLSVSASGGGEAVSAANDPASAVKSLCVLQFEGPKAEGGPVGALRHVSIAESTGTAGQYTAKVEKSASNKDKYVFALLANLDGSAYTELSKQVTAKKNYQQVSEWLKNTFSGKQSFTGEKPFPLFGVNAWTRPYTVGETTNGDLGTSSLIRSVARVDIGLGTLNKDGQTWSKGRVPFVMEEIQIYKVPNSYYSMPAQSHIDYSEETAHLKVSGARNFQGTGAITQTLSYANTEITNGTYCSGKIYLPEYDFSKQREFNRLAIILKGKYNNSATSTYYRIDFTDKLNVDGNILRNHVYRFTITNVTKQGYNTAEEAYKGTEPGLAFTATVDAWAEGIHAKPHEQTGIGALMYFDGLNGSVTSLYTFQGIRFFKKEKSRYWTGKHTNPASPLEVDYNDFYGEVHEAPGRKPAYPNGDLYSDEENILKVEGPYPRLMVANYDITNYAGWKQYMPWKDGSRLIAFDACRNYNAGGYTDWRLPRFSELLLMYLNKDNLYKAIGFHKIEPYPGYWSGSEYGKSTDKNTDLIWVITTYASDSSWIRSSWSQKSDRLRVRCVRQVN